MHESKLNEDILIKNGFNRMIDETLDNNVLYYELTTTNSDGNHFFLEISNEYSNYNGRDWYVHVDNEYRCSVGCCDVGTIDDFNLFMKALNTGFEINK